MPCTIKTRSCTACYFKRRPLLTLRGLCRGSNFDKDYILTLDYQNNKPVIRGYFNTIIHWTAEKDENGHQSRYWKMSSVLTNSTFGRLVMNSPN